MRTLIVVAACILLSGCITMLEAVMHAVDVATTEQQKKLKSLQQEKE